MKNSNKVKVLIGLVFLHFLFYLGFLHCHKASYYRCFASTNTTLEDLKEVLKGDILIVGMDPDFPPMGFLNEEGKPVGADVELAKAIANKMGNKMGIEVKFQPINWDLKEAEVNSGKVHLLWNGFSKTPEREAALLLSKPYMKNKQQIIVKKDSKINNLADLKGKQVCLQKGSSAEGSFEKSSLSSSVKNVIKLESCVDCLNEVRQNKSDAAVVDEVVARFHINNFGAENEFRILPEILTEESFVIGMKKGNDVLCRAIEQAYNELATENPEVLEQISKKWFGRQLFLPKMGPQTNEAGSTSQPVSAQSLNGETNVFSSLASALLVTLKLFLLCLLFSLPLGLAFCLIRNFKIKLLNFFINFYIAVMRGTPLLLQLFFAFYALPMMIPGLVLKNRFLVGLIVFILNYAAYFAEIFRGGLVSISRGQFEAAAVLQIPKFKAVSKIFLPQMLKVCLPSICNETVALVKDTALIFSLGVVEFLTMAKNLVNSTANVSIYIIVAVVYFVICSLLNLIFDLIERKLKFE